MLHLNYYHQKHKVLSLVRKRLMLLSYSSQLELEMMSCSTDRRVPDSHEQWIITTMHSLPLGGVMWITDTTSSYFSFISTNQDHVCKRQQPMRSAMWRTTFGGDVTSSHPSWVLSVCIPHVNSFFLFFLIQALTTWLSFNPKMLWEHYSYHVVIIGQGICDTCELM